MSKSIIASVVISLSLIGGAVYFVSDVSTGTKQEAGPVQNVEVRDGVQYVTVVAQGGYSPRISEVASGIPTKLIVKTDGTYDCSSALVIRSLGFQKTLEPTGEEVIDLGVLKAGDKIQGLCSMGMYNFQIRAS